MTTKLSVLAGNWCDFGLVCCSISKWLHRWSIFKIEIVSHLHRWLFMRNSKTFLTFQTTIKQPYQKELNIWFKISSKINFRKIIHRDNLIFWIVFSCSVIFFLSFNCEKQNQQKIQACLLLKFCQNWILGISGQKLDFSAKKLRNSKKSGKMTQSLNYPLFELNPSLLQIYTFCTRSFFAVRPFGTKNDVTSFHVPCCAQAMAWNQVQLS